MLIVPPQKPRKNRRIEPRAQVSGPPALTLISAYYDDTLAQLFMVFDRAVDLAGLVGTVVQVVDGSINGQTYLATGPVVMLDDHTVRIELQSVGSASGPDVELNVGSDNGIVAVDDGAAWAGVSGVALPFG